MKKVKDVMVREFPVIKEQTTIKEIIEIFSSSYHNILPVVDIAGKLIGIVSIEELLENLIFSKEDLAMLEKISFLADFFTDALEKVDSMSQLVLAKDIMQKNVFTVKEDDSVLKAFIIMKKKNIHRLIVINAEHIPVGYISRNEVCKAFLI
jgi:predicted transcriptional regulator